MDKKSILVISKDRGEIEWIMQTLGGAYSLIPALNFENGVKVTKAKSIDMVFVDINSLDDDSLEFLKELAKKRVILFVVDSIEQMKSFYGLSLYDFISKDELKKGFDLRVRNYLYFSEYLNSLVDSKEQIKKESLLFDAKKRFEESEKPLQMALVEIENFVKIEEFYGGQNKQTPLNTLNRVLSDSLAGEVYIYRVEDERFLLLANSFDLDSFSKALGKLKIKANNLQLFENSEKLKSSICAVVSRSCCTNAIFEECFDSLNEPLDTIKGCDEVLLLETDSKTKILTTSKKKVMVVEDTKVMQKILGSILEELGHDVIAYANNGKEAIELFKKDRADLIVMDLDMPIMDGLTSTKEILKIDDSTKVLMVSAHKGSRIKQDSVADGASGYITKPFSKEEIEREIFSIFS